MFFNGNCELMFDESCKWESNGFSNELSMFLLDLDFFTSDDAIKRCQVRSWACKNQRNFLEFHKPSSTAFPIKNPFLIHQHSPHWL